MFCPNCGTQNPETSTACSKCGFNLKGAASPKFKGTMLMMNAPGAAAPPRPAAPPAAPAAPPAAKPNFKGTMIVGGAPPPPNQPGPPAPAPYAEPPAPYAAPPAPADFGAPPPPFGAPPPAFGGAPQFGAAPAFGAPPVNPLSGTMPSDSGFGAPAPMAQPGFPPPAPAAPPAYGDQFGAPQQQQYGAPQQQYGAPQQPYGAPAQAPAFADIGMGGPPPAAYGSQPLDQMGFGAPQAMVPAGGPMGMAQPGFGGSAPMGGGGPKGQIRNPMMSLLISWFCFFYAIYVTYQMVCELKAYLNTEEITPWFALFFPLNLMLILKLPALVTEAKRRAGVANPEAGGLFMYLFFTPYIMSKDLNEVWNPTGG